jgi:hypothetical protein
MLATGITAAIVLTASSLLKMPLRHDLQEMHLQNEVVLGRAADTLINDLREATPSSIAWGTLPASGAPFQFQKALYDPSNPDVPLVTAFQYTAVTQGGSQTADLYRTEGTTTTLVVKGVYAPTASWPLVEQDTSTYHHLVIRLAMQSSEGKRAEVIRRFTTRG